MQAPTQIIWSNC